MEGRFDSLFVKERMMGGGRGEEFRVTGRYIWLICLWA